MSGRLSLYKEIHKGVRSLMFEVTTRSGRVDFHDAEQVAAFRADVERTFRLLAAHAEHENEWIGPVIAKHAPALSDHIGMAHDDHESHFNAILSGLDAIDASAADAAVKGHRIVVSLSRFFGDLMVHMADEEQEVMPAIWAALTEEQVQTLHHDLVASIAPQEMAEWAAYMIPSANTPERVAMLGGMKLSAPPQVFAMFRELARRLLTPQDDAALERGLEALEPVAV